MFKHKHRIIEINNQFYPQKMLIISWENYKVSESSKIFDVSDCFFVGNNLYSYVKFNSINDCINFLNSNKRKFKNEKI